MKIKLFILSLFFAVLLVIPSTFAVDDISNEAVESNVNDDVLSTNEYYFDSSASRDGDGSQANPYKTLSYQRLKSDSIYHFSTGTYNITNSKRINDFSFYGEDASKTIINGNGNFLITSGVINFKDITLSNFVIYNEEGSVSATNSIFSNSNGISDNSYSNYGGSIYLDNSQLTLTDCIFKNNHAEYGGAIFAVNSVMQISNTVFSNNVAYNYGGAITAKSSRLTITNSRFSNQESSNDAGGSIYLISSNFTGNTINFTNSKAVFGGAICALDSNVDLTDILAMNNVASYFGGAIYSMYGSFKLKNSKFINNTAYNGGALFIDNVTEGKVLSNDFINNNALYYGGAIYAFLNDFTFGTNNYNGNHAKNHNDLFETNLLNMFVGNGNYTLYSGNLTYDGNIPTYYNLAELGYDTSVKNQENGGSCWAFSAIAALESCILKAGGNPLDLSEENMKNVIALFSDYGWRNKFPNDGGNFYMALGYLASWLGPIYDIQDLYDGESALSPVFNSIMHVQNALFLKRTAYTDNDEIKKAILKYGSVSTSIYYDDNFLLSGYKYYYSGSNNSDHAVTIVGWNDTMNIAGYTGAWIVKNSWGPEWGNNGYFYVSYYDTTLLELNKYDAFTFILNDTIPYDKNYQYDTGFNSPLTWNYKEFYYKNKFVSTEDEYLAAVSTYFIDSYDWQYEIFVNGISKCSQSGSSAAGYYTFQLPEFIQLHKGDTFEVVFKLISDNKISLPIFKSSIVTGFGSGVSFISNNGVDYFMVSDLGSKYANTVVGIKAFTFLNDIKTQTSINLSYDGLFNISARVVDQYGNLLKSGKVTFTVNGVSNVYDVVNGVVSFKTSLNKESNSISAVFDSVGYESSSNSTSFNRTSIVADNFSTVYGSGDSYSVSLSDLYGSSVVNRVVKFVLSNGDSFTTSTNANGVALLPIDLDAGSYDVTIQYAGYGSSDATLSVVKSIEVSKKLVALSINKDISKNNASIRVSTTENINSAVVISVDGVDKNYAFVDGKVLFNLYNLGYGSHTVKVKDLANYEFSNSALTFNIIIKKSKMSANKLVTFYGSNALFYVTLLDENNSPVSSKEIVFSVNGNTYKNTTDASGLTAIPINLPLGSFNITANFGGDDYYFDCECRSDVLVKSTIILPDVASYVAYTSYSAFFLDGNGDALANGKVKFTLNNKDSEVFCDADGKAVFNLDVDANDYTIKLTNLETGEVASQLIKVTNLLSYTYIDLVYDGLFNISARVVDQQGNLLKSGKVTFTVNGVSNVYDVVNGVVSFKTSLNKESNFVSAVFDGVGYESSSNSTSFNRTSIVADNFSTVYGSGDSYSVSLSDLYGSSVVNRVVKFVLSNGDSFTTSTNANGVALLPIDLDAGSYDVTIQYAGYGSSDANLSVVKSIEVSKKLVTLSINKEISKNNASISVSAADAINEGVVIAVDGIDKNYAFVNGKVLFNLSNLEYGLHSIKVNDLINYNFSNNELTFVINKSPEITLMTDRIISNGDNALFYVTLTDDEGKPVENKTVIFTVDGVNYKNTTDASGSTAVSIMLTQESINITAKVDGSDNYNASSCQSNLLVNSGIILQTDKYAYNTNYSAIFLNVDGTPQANTKVKFTLNNEDHELTCDENGKALLNIPNEEGNYAIKLTNLLTGDVLSYSIKVGNPKDDSKNETENKTDDGNTPSTDDTPQTKITYMITQNSDLIMYYGDSKYYQVRVCNNNGEFVEGIEVIFTFRGVHYVVTTDSMGYASIRLSLNSGTYTITAKIDGYEVSNKIIVKPTLTAKNIKVKKGKPIKFTAKLVDINGKALKKKKITFKFKGKKYKVKTNKKGVATLKVTKKFKSGKYPIYTSYGKMKIKNIIKIR